MKLKELEIDGVSCRSNLILAPMSGVTNSHFRRLILSENPGSLGLVVTEFISIEGMTRGNGQSLRMMQFREEERPISVQIFGHRIDRMVEAAKMIEASGADIVDINCGCPVPKVVKRGGGCELMRQPKHLAEMLSAVRSAISIPLTLKIRSGWDSSSRNGVEIAHIAQESGVSMLAVHGRTRKDLYRGQADWNLIAEIAESLRIPVVGSGDVVDGQSALEAFKTGVDGVMIGRGALSNPWVFREIASSLNGIHFSRPSDLATVDVLEKYMSLLREDLPDKAVIGKMKQFASQVTRRVRGSSLARRSMCRSKSLAEFEDVLALWREFLLSKSSLEFSSYRQKPSPDQTVFRC